MKQGIHPELFEVEAICSCKHTIKIRSTQKVIHSTLCSNCHPFFTGQQKFVDTAGRIEKFKKKYTK